MGELKKNRHASYYLEYKLAIKTKNGICILEKDIKDELEDIVKRLFEKWECEIYKITINSNNIVIRFSAPPQIQLSILVNNLKTVTSRLLRKKFDTEIGMYGTLWERSYLIGIDSEETDKFIIKYFS